MISDMDVVTFERIRSLLLSGAQDVNEEDLKLALIGICRDLKGVVSVCSSRSTYLLLFEWMYPCDFCGLNPVISLPDSSHYCP